PERMGKLRATAEWLKDVFKRKASVKDFKARVFEPEAHYVDETPNILIYEDRVKISKERYWEMMQDIMADREQVYKKMSDELYWLGQLANKQFKYLKKKNICFPFIFHVVLGEGWSPFVRPPRLCVQQQKRA
ncbi:Pycsar system effector family protein, partial [Neisseria canis]|uniref:Pycsar system effector family protein n=1 Tax=Neisseria canis TaxID=493 RepID=UPI0020124EA7